MMINTLERPTNPFFAWRRPIRLGCTGCSACVYYVTTSFLIIFFLIFLVVVRTPFWVVVVVGGGKLSI